MILLTEREWRERQSAHAERVNAWLDPHFARAKRGEMHPVRDSRWPLRFDANEIARIVESSSIRCTHFDAFRFFTPDARPLNRVQPTRKTSASHEQRGCLHANMDLYKWAFKLAPFTPSELV